MVVPLLFFSVVCTWNALVTVLPMLFPSRRRKKETDQGLPTEFMGYHLALWIPCTSAVKNNRGTTIVSS